MQATKFREEGDSLPRGGTSDQFITSGCPPTTSSKDGDIFHGTSFPSSLSSLYSSDHGGDFTWPKFHIQELVAEFFHNV
ncbi:hypothetical protein NPIL_71171 [Nephila pilipes]|uniref:Uncharacterized protein n=1 Tax=Nephila pilipes TaxID=299642 RepID=A0A8X6MUQ7_NEPPI|nr:hypothetical protein NPIL_71171 [Nephila pilipes]